MKKKISFLLKLLFSAGACIFIFTRLDYRHFFESFLTARLPLLALGLLLAFAAQVLGSLRMKLLLAGIPVRFSYILFTNFAAMFIRLTVPSDVGAELGRGYYFSRKTGSPALAFSAIILERYCGLFSQFSVLAGSTLAYGLIRHQAFWTKVGISGLAVALAFVGAILLFFRLPKITAGPRRGLARLRNVMASFAGYVQAFRDAPVRLAGAAAISIAVQICNLLIIMAVSGAYDTPIAFHEASVIVILATIGFYLPISVAGLGVVEGIYAAMFKLFLLQKEIGVAVSLTLRILGVIVAVPGMFFFIFGEKMIRGRAEAEKK